MPDGAEYILSVLSTHGYGAYIVGGCVRDALLSRHANDFDITTSALPEQIKSLFDHTVDTGIKHGTVTVIVNGEPYEVTTYRVDGEYEDHRRPTSVTFTASLLEDMKRRDFTINAMAYNEKEGVIDHFDGMKDLERRCIRCVGEPKERFDEDALRILRALRFSAQLDFSIDERTQDAIRNQAVFLKDISAERIHVELTKLLVSKHPERLRTAYELGVTKIVLPEFDAMMRTEQNNPHHMYTVGEHTLRVVKEVQATECMRWAALLHDVAKPATKVSDENGDHFYGHNYKGADLAEQILLRLKFDNATIARVKRIVLWHDYGMGKVPSLRSFRKSLSKMGADLFDDYVDIKRADTLAQSEYMQNEKLANLETLKLYYRQIIEEQQCLSLKDLAVTGKDLIEQGMKPGKELGAMLQELLECVLENPELNDWATLLGIVKEKLLSVRK